MYPHRIRLRGPWQSEPLPDARGLRFRRGFGYPGRIDAHERVWLTFDGFAGLVQADLNGRVLGQVDGRDGPFEWEVTSLLQPRNLLTLDVAGATPESRGDVALEVRCTAFLHAMRAWYESGRLHVTGELVGAFDGPLDLYVIAGRSTVIHASLANPGAFHLVSETVQETYASLQVELIKGAVVWYSLATATQSA